MIVKIKSDNPNFLNILYKNNKFLNGIQVYPHKNGYMIGKIISNNQYDILFQDTKYSYNEDMSNMLDQQSLSNPRIILDINNIFFKHLLKSNEEVLLTKNAYANATFGEIDNQECIIEFSNVYIESNWAKGDKFILSTYFNQIESFSRISGNQYKFNIRCSNVMEAVNLSSLIFLMLCVVNEQPFFLTDDLIKKYIRIIKNIGNVPYFVIYLFKVRLLFNYKLFENNKKALEELIPNMKLTIYNNHQQRIEYITNMIKDDSNDILDFGCGELKYFKKISQLLSDNRNYYAVDMKDYSEYLDKLKSKSTFNASFHTNVYDISLKNKTTVIFTEVLEHMGYEVSHEYLEYLLNQPLIDKIIITTPNKDFNQYYEMDTEMRHKDHVIELTYKDFVEYISNIVNSDIFDVEFGGICDEIDGITPTSIAIIKRK